MLRNVALLRCTHYFTVWELLGRRTKETDVVWRRLKTTVDLDRPISPQDLRSLLGILEVEPGLVGRTQERVRRHMMTLTDDDVILERGDAGYPDQLATTDDAPEFLFVRGNAQLLHRPALAVVGTRNPSEQGVRRAQKLGHLLAEQDIVVTSGLAKGIDRAAHLGALSVGGNTIAVVGTPLTKAYPPEHQSLQQQIGELGAVVSQFYPGAGTRQFYFPMRNAVMSGLCLGTIVVEASETSGALIQARQCLKQGRKLFIPQSALDNPNLTWPSTYLRKPNAHRFSQIEDLLSALKRENLLASGVAPVLEGVLPGLANPMLTVKLVPCEG